MKYPIYVKHAQTYLRTVLKREIQFYSYC